MSISLRTAKGLEEGLGAGYVSRQQCLTGVCMAGRNGQELLGTWVPSDVAAQFKVYARTTEGGVSAELRRLILDATQGKAAAAPGAAGHKVMVRLKEEERLSLLQAARERATTPANWLRSLALAHLSRRPQWNDAEVEALRDVFVELRRIGNNVNQIARALNVAAHTGEMPMGQGQAAREAAENVAAEVRRIGGLAVGNLEYWNVYREETASASPGRKARGQ